MVTPDIAELRSDWAQEHRDRHFVVAASCDRSHIDAAHERALALFRAEGGEAQHVRHRLALERHLFEHRIERILDMLREAAAHGLEAVRRPAT